MLFCLNLLQKGIFLLSTLPPSSPSPLPSQAVGQRISRFLSYISCVPSVSTANLKRYHSWPKKLHSTTTIKPWQSTWETPRLPTVPRELQGGLTHHLGMSLYKHGFNYTHPHTAVAQQLPYHARIAVFYGQPAAEILMLLLYFRERKKA